MKFKCSGLVYLFALLLAPVGFVCAQSGIGLSGASGKQTSNVFGSYTMHHKHLVVLPTHELFLHDRPTTINPAFYQGITAVADAIRGDQPPFVEVDVYGNGSGLADQAIALTRAQARTVAAYLWSQGLPACQIRHRGRGDVAPLLASGGAAGDYFNARVEIRWVY